MLAGAVALALVSATGAAAAPRAAAAVETPQDTGPNLARMTQARTYFNRPGADAAIHQTELRACMQKADGARAMDELIGNDKGLIPALLSAGPKKGVYAAAIENCMVVAGWRVVQPPAEESTMLAGLPAAELAAALEPWLGAETPPHPIVRVWNNEAANAAVKRFEIRPNYIDQGSLSVMAVTGSREAPYSAPPPRTYGVVKLDKTWPKKVLKPAQIAALRPDAGVIIVHIRGVSMRNGVAVSFQREWIDGRTPPSAVDRRPDMFMAAMGLLGAKPEGRYIAMPVVPGRWRLSSMGILPAVNFCLGSPAFEVAAGEVVYAGSFDMSAADITPDLTLDGVKAYLAGQPAAGTVRAADYVNGYTGQCMDSTIYSVEFAGAPFKSDYAGGSKAPARDRIVAAPAVVAPSAPAAVAEPAPAAL